MRRGVAIGLVAGGVVLAVAAGVAFVSAAGSWFERAGSAPAPPATRPNIVVLETDDQTVESMKVMVNTRRLLGAEGTTFTNSFVSLPLCCPSRATLLTGQYAHNHGVWSNDPPTGGYAKLDNRNTLAVWLRRAGYETALVGKYLNGFPPETSPTAVPPGWSRYYGNAAGIYNYFGFILNQNRRLVSLGPAAYHTDALAWYAGQLIRERALSKRPLFLWVAFIAPHVGSSARGEDEDQGSAVPAPRHFGRVGAFRLPRPPSFNEADVSDKHRRLRERARLTRREIKGLGRAYAAQLASLLAVDEAVGTIVKALGETGQLDNTLIVFTSDNGYLNGAHRERAKGLPYEGSVRVPLILRGPNIPAGRRRSQPVANIDLAPTIVQAARVRPRRRMDGLSLFALTQNPRLGSDRALLLEGPKKQGITPAAGVRTARYKYIEFAGGERELYDLARDPDELRSQAKSPAYAAVRARLAGLLAKLRRCRGSSCRLTPGLGGTAAGG